MVRNNQLEMFYVDDSLNPVDFNQNIDNCWTIWKMTSSDPVTWNWQNSTQTNACGHSPIVKYDDSRSRYVIVRIDNAHNTNAHIVTQYSTDGVTFTSPTEILPSWILPHYSHNLGSEGDEYGHFVDGETPLIAWAAPGDFRYDTNWWLPWDLYGARLDVLSGSPGPPSSAYTLGGSTAATPLTGDIDGDGKDDLVIFDPTGTHTWSIAESSRGYGTPLAVADFGSSGQVPFLAHFNPAVPSGADLVLYDAGTGNWSIAYSANAVH